MRRTDTRRPRSSVRGLTLVELLVGTMIAAFLTAAAFAFAAHESRLMGVSRERVELSQASRAAIDLIADDLAQAGSGLGYATSNPQWAELMAPCPGRCFAGLLMGRFALRGNVYNAQLGVATQGGNNMDMSSLPLMQTVGSRGSLGTSAPLFTQDFGVRMANGSYATIAEYNAVGGQHCLPDPATGATAFRPVELAVLRHQDGIFARSVVMSPAGGPCLNAVCRNGCQSFNFVLDAESTYASDLGTGGASYLGGELQGGLQTVTWFIRDQLYGNNVQSGRLFRAVHDATTCVAPANLNNCAGVVADFAESLNIRAWVWDRTTAPPSWRLVGQQPINSTDRIRVDIELVLRSRVADTKPHQATLLQLQDGACVPGTCATDAGDRRAFRTTVEVANSGRMAFNP